MSMIKLIYNNEMRLLFRNKFLALPFIITLICWGYVIFSYEKQSIHYEEVAAVFYNSFQWIVMLNLLMVGLLSVYMAGKDQESEFEFLVVTYKVKNMEWIFGKWLVAQTYGFFITIITLLIQGIWFSTGSMSTTDGIKNLIFLFFQLEGAIFLLVSFGFLFGILLKNRFAYFCIPALLGITLLLQSNSYGFAPVNPRLNLLSLYDVMFIASPFEGIWGINRVFEGVILHQIAAILLGSILIAAACLLFRPFRRLQIEKSLGFTLMIILLIPAVVVGGIRYTQYDSAIEQFVHTGKQYLTAGFEGISSFYDKKSDNKKSDFSMERTNLNVQFPSENQIEVNSQLSIKYMGDVPVNEVSLTLHNQLKITDCLSDRKLSYSRKDDLLTIHFPNKIEPGEQFDLKLNYEGNVQQYRYDGLLENSFIASDRIYLPKEAGWYPLIGERQLAKSTDHLPNERYVGFELRNGQLVEDYPTEFTVTFRNKGESIPISLTIPRLEDGSYKGISQYGLSMIGGNLEEVLVNQTRVVGHPEVLDGARKTTEVYMEWWDYIEKWLEIPIVPEVIYILNREHKNLTQVASNEPFIAWSVDDIKYVDPFIMAYVFSSGLIEGNPSLNDKVYLLKMAIVWSLFNHFQIETGANGFDDWYNQNIQGFQYELPTEDAILLDIMNGYDKQGEEEFQQVVKYLFTQYHALEDKAKFDLAAELESYVGVKSQ